MVSKPPIKVLIIVENLPVPFDRRVWQEANALCAAGYQVSIICPKAMTYQAAREVINDIYIYRHPILVEADSPIGYLLEYSSAILGEFILSWVVFFERGFDVIHACNPPDTIFLIGAFYKFFFRKKFLFDHHDINPELYLAKFQRKDFFYRLLLFLEFLTFKTADLSLATNASFKAIALQRGRKKAEDVFIVRNGPDLKRMKIVPAEPELKMGKEYLVGYMGVMGKQDGIDYFLRTIHYLVHELKRTDIHFTLLGSGTEFLPMQAYTVKLGLQEYVTFAGWVSDEYMQKLLSTADLCVVPDEVNEMNDISTLAKTMDYMAFGKPIVQFELKEGRVTAQEASLYAKANDEKDMAHKIITLLEYADLRQAMGAYGRQRIESELAWDHQVPKLLAAYAKLLQ